MAERRSGLGGQGRAKFSNYGVQLREKQKVKRMYGLAENQFRNFFAKPEPISGCTGDSLLMMLERRLDNTVYRLGFAGSRDQARQLVSAELADRAAGEAEARAAARRTVSAALRQMEAAHRVVAIDLRRRDMEDEAWDRVIAAILDSDLTITI